ncbi:MAG: GNAT family N-acetyltransferase [Erysipelotrichaceae bacterium]|nr:GNAT family N-acetyltransferase [Erysipelotrichaceae bacterium]
MKITLQKWKMSDLSDLIDMQNHLDRTWLTDQFPVFNELIGLLWLRRAGKPDVYARAIYVDGKLAGSIYATRQIDIYGHNAELSYYLRKEYMDQGIMSYVLPQFLDEVYDQLHIHKLYALVFAENKASCRVLEKNGFILEGIQKEHLFKHDSYHDMCVYGSIDKRGDNQC